jgi:hypothetical protein
VPDRASGPRFGGRAERRLAAGPPRPVILAATSFPARKTSYLARLIEATTRLVDFGLAAISHADETCGSR